MKEKPVWIEMMPRFLIVVFCGFYLRSVVWNPIYISFIVGVLLYCINLLKRMNRIICDKAVQWSLAYIGYILLSQPIHGITSSMFNVLLSVVYFMLAYNLLVSDEKENIINYSKWFLRVSILLLIVEAVYRYLTPVHGQVGIYQYKLTSIMYTDSNFVAMFVMSLIFFALYLHEKNYAKLGIYILSLFALLLATLSRAAIITTIVFILVFTKKVSRKWKSIFFVLGGIAALIVLSNMLGDESNQTRFLIIDQAFDFYFNRASFFEKLFGVGFGRAQEYIGYGTHLFIITQLIESGLVGFVLLGFYWVAILRYSKLACKYIIYPFLLAGFAMGPHLITYIYCELAIILILETKDSKEADRCVHLKSLSFTDKSMMMKDMCQEKVSVIIPVYNAEKFLSRCIDSVLQQTHQNLEIILIDDGSSDKSLQICCTYAEIDSRVVVLHHENHGVSYTRNCGLNTATGEYITFIDADDWVEAEYVESLLLSIRMYHVEIAMCGYDEAYNDGHFEKKKDYIADVISAEDALNMFSPYYIGAVWGKMYSKNALQYLDGKSIQFDEDVLIAEDQLFWVQAVLNVGRIYVNCTPLYHYYMNMDSVMRNRGFSQYYMEFCARKKISKLLMTMPKLEEASIMFCTASAAQAMSVSNAAVEDERMVELKAYVSSNLKLYLKHPGITTKEKIRAILVNKESIRKLLLLALKYRQRNN